MPHLERMPFGDFLVGYQCDSFDLGDNISGNALQRGTTCGEETLVPSEIHRPFGRIVTPQDRFSSLGPPPADDEPQTSKSLERFRCEVSWTAAVRGTDVRPKAPPLIGLLSGTAEVTVTEKVALRRDTDHCGRYIIPAWQRFRYFRVSKRLCSAKCTLGLPEGCQRFTASLVGGDIEVVPRDGGIAGQIVRKKLDDGRGPLRDALSLGAASGRIELRYSGRPPFLIATFRSTDRDAASEGCETGVVENLSQ